MELQTLSATSRDASGKGAARRTRGAGAVPAVLYGQGKEAVCLKLDAKVFQHLIHSHRGSHAVVQLDVTDNPEWSSPALVKSLQYHPLRGDIVHADFLRIRLDERIETSVPVTLQGQAKGIIEGGVVDHQLREVEVECMALEVPEELFVDVTGLSIGDSLHVRDLQVPPNVAFLTDPDRVVVSVFLPRVVKAATEGEEAAVPVEGAEAAESAEPEVVGRRKEKEKEEEE